MTERAILPLLICLLLVGSSRAADTTTHVVTDFESADAMGLVKAYANEVTKVEAGDGGHALLWRLPGKGETCGISIGGVPRDVTACRFLRLRYRCDGTARDTVHIRLRSGEAVLAHPPPALTPAWQSAEIPIPEMRPLGGEFDPAADFSSRLRSGQYVPLRDFFACSELIATNDRRGSARNGAAAYAQAGAFFEFLLRGPFGEGRADLIAKLAAVRETGAARVPAIEKILGKSVTGIEAAWLAWGKKPPKIRK